MDFDQDAQLDTSQVSDRRGVPGGALTIGGGVVGLLVLLVAGVLGFTGALPLPGDDSGATDLAEKCGPGNPDRWTQRDCRTVAIFNDLQAFWSRDGANALGSGYDDPKLVIFSRQVTTGCGPATSDVGPFYCPADSSIYLDLTFFDELANRFGAPGQFAQAYVVAHEFGHHMQNLTGQDRQIRALQQQDPGNANKYSIALELQADCYAGVWGRQAGDGPMATTDEQDLKEGLEAAGAVGDDTIQQQTSGQLRPDDWTHGSAQQRQFWFFQGFRTGDPQQCKTLQRG
jgi:predicted metalloprotease